MFKRRRFESRIRRKIRMTMLPYGVWHCAYGRQVLFSRQYVPLWERDVYGRVQRANPHEWVSWKRERFFYTDSTLNKAAVAIRVIERFTGFAWCWQVAKVERQFDDQMAETRNPGNARRYVRGRILVGADCRAAR